MGTILLLAACVVLICLPAKYDPAILLKEHTLKRDGELKKKPDQRKASSTERRALPALPETAHGAKCREGK